jgi:hypothetical protein
MRWQVRRSSPRPCAALAARLRDQSYHADGTASPPLLRSRPARLAPNLAPSAAAVVTLASPHPSDLGRLKSGRNNLILAILLAMQDAKTANSRSRKPLTCGNVEPWGLEPRASDRKMMTSATARQRTPAGTGGVCD